MGPACHSIASQSGNQSDSQSEAHTALSATDGRLSGPLDPFMTRVPPSCGRAHAPAHTGDASVSPAHPQPALQFQLVSSQCPFSTGEPPEAVTPERHSVFLRPPEISASIDLDSEGDTVQNRGIGTVPSKPQKERIQSSSSTQTQHLDCTRDLSETDCKQQTETGYTMMKLEYTDSAYSYHSLRETR